MKYIASLPPAKHYRLLKSSNGRWTFEDKLTSALRIQSPVENPWGQAWKIIASMQYQKADRSQYPYRLVLRLFPPDGDGIPATLEREYVKGVFAWSGQEALSFYAFPTERKSLWVFYTFLRA